MNYLLIRKSGLLIFCLGLAFFLSAFWMERYEVEKTMMEKEFGDYKQGILIDGLSALNGQTFGSIQLVSILDEKLQEINEKQLDKYELGSKISSMLLVQGESGVIDFKKWEEIFDLNESVQAYQWKALNDYGVWLNGKEYRSTDELKDLLNQVNDNIKKYGILSDKGFSDSEIKTLKYDIVRKSSHGLISNQTLLMFLLIYGMIIIGAAMYILPASKTKGPAGIKNDGIFHHAMTNVGWLGITVGSFLITFYILLYFFPEYITPWVMMVDPVSYVLKGSEAGRFFFYGFVYTVTIIVMGIRMMIKYRHSRYQILRTFSVIFFQTAFAFLIPEILVSLNQPYFDFKNIWPLDYDFFFEYELNKLMASGSLGIFMLGWGIGLIIIAVPVFVYFFGKRWYCSWVCGCGGLAETLGDPYRQLSDKTLKAWKVERVLIHSVLVFSVVMTAGVLYTYWTGNSEIFGVSSYRVRSVYGFGIGSVFSGVIGTGFYPLMGNRVWCRFGCPLAAYLGLVQRFKSRFRITTNGGQCISCGNCSTYCEMGIDVRAYAQKGENIIRSSCVGCGVCSAVCPRGVLNLENRSDDNRFVTSGLLGTEKVGR